MDAIHIFFAVVGAIAFVVLCILLMYFQYPGEMQNITNQYPQMVGRFLDNTVCEKPIQFSPKELKLITRNYRTKIGSGGFGVVYFGYIPSRPMAVKVLNHSLDQRVEEQFMAEISTIHRTNHMNLVKLYGYCSHPMLRALVYEYMENGSLDNFLFGSHEKLEWEKLHNIAIGTAMGIAYLHEECEQTIIHYDIKPDNILLDKNFSPKVADFGLAKLCNRVTTHMTMTGGRGTPGYVAPELWMPFPITHKCDVYSFGMLLFEIVGHQRNLNFNQTENQEWFPRWVWEKYEKGELEELVTVCRIEGEDREKVKRMSVVALWCVQYLPAARPSMSSVVKMLEGGMEIAVPPNPFLYLLLTAVDTIVWKETDHDSTITEGTKNEIQVVSSS